MTDTLLPPGVTAPAKPASKEPIKTPFNFGTYLAEARKEEEAALLPPGRYDLTVSDARVAAEPNDKGLIYAVLQCEAEDAEIAMIIAGDLSDDLKGDDGMPDAARLDEDPMVKRQFLSGLAQLEQLQKACGITAEEMAEAESADDAIASFIGSSFKAIVARGKDQYGLPTNTIRKIVGKADVR